MYIYIYNINIEYGKIDFVPQLGMNKTKPISKHHSNIHQEPDGHPRIKYAWL